MEELLRRDTAWGLCAEEVEDEGMSHARDARGDDMARDDSGINSGASAGFEVASFLLSPFLSFI